MNSQNIIGIAIDELYRIFEILNKQYFSGSLESPIITIQKAKSSGNLGWFTTDKIWSDREEVDKKYEINICAEHLKSDTYMIVETLLHEMCHYANKVSEIKDCNGNIHNKKFKQLAESVGLIVEKSKKYGYGHTSCSGELVEFINAEIMPDETCFQYFRSIIVKPVKEGKKKTIFTYICSQCGEKVKGKENIIIKCVNCDCEFEMKD